MNANEIKEMTIEELVEMHNETVDPFDFLMPFIKENCPQTLREIEEVFGGSWMDQALTDGEYRTTDKYVYVLEDYQRIYSLSTPEDFFRNLATPETLAEYWA